MNIRLADEVLSDLEEVREWYRRQRPALADRFTRAVGVGLQHVEMFPESRPPIHGPVWRVLLRGFPYALFYFIDQEADLIVVTGCFHTARDPSTWQERTDLQLP